VSSSSPLLAVEGLSAAWSNRPVLRSVTFSVAPGELFVLMGPNGSGKTTLLRMLAGFEAPTAGRILLEGRDLAGSPPHRRGIPLMFQDAVLFPHRTVYENLAYAPLLQRRPRAEVDEEVGRLVELLHLQGYEDRPPDALSGGERQRVALGRTLAARPKLVLLDEPFASIDPELRLDLRAEFRRVLARLGTAAIHVTHDREEGLFLGDRVGLLFDGELEAVGPPGELYASPTSVRAARFLGYNVVREGGGARAVHPEDVRLGPAGSGGIDATVVAAGGTGRGTSVLLETGGGDRLEARDPTAGSAPPLGTRASVSWSREVPLREAGPPGEGAPGPALGPKSPRTAGG
jgi:ABC-type Fe3+/spermidine/putrescine transport system ATPase subunit